MTKIVRKSSENYEVQFPTLNVLKAVMTKSISRHYCFQNVEDGIQIRIRYTR